MTNRIQRFIAFLLVLCIPIFAIAGCTNNDVANAANQVTTNANGCILSTSDADDEEDSGE